MKTLGLFGAFWLVCVHARSLCRSASFASVETQWLLTLACLTLNAGSRGRLPQVGFNSVRTGMDHPQVQFPEEFPINRETLLQFATAFLSGQLQTSMDTQNAMVAFRPFSTYNAVTRRDKIGHSPEIRGVSEQLKIHDAVTQVNLIDMS